jgi:2-iminobutanoate/2-iminopropanoate deaminase
MEKMAHDVDVLAKGGPYSHVVAAGGFLFVSGMLPTDPKRQLAITDDIKAATELVLTNIKKVLESVGSGVDKVVKTIVFLRDTADFNGMNDVYRTFFPEKPPARSCVTVREIPGNFPLEIDAIAIE